MCCSCRRYTPIKIMTGAYTIFYLFMTSYISMTSSYSPVTYNVKDKNWLFSYSQFQGQDFCRTNRPRCCPNRDDACAVPIYGTLCYCDEFCDRDVNADCCPDFLPVCRGITPPQEQRRKEDGKYGSRITSRAKKERRW